MNDVFATSVMFGIVVTLLAFCLARVIQSKTKSIICNPLLISTIFIAIFLITTKTSYETYNYGSRYISDFLTPATVCLAVPMYKQFQILKKNIWAVLGGLFAGCIGHGFIIVGLGIALKIKHYTILSVLPKSVTTAIAMGTCEEIGGNPAIVIIGVIIAGNVGAIVGPAVLKLIGVREPVAQGLAIGACSHAIGTSTAAVPMGEVQGAMSSLAIVVTGLMTVIVVPFFAAML